MTKNLNESKENLGKCNSRLNALAEVYIPGSSSDNNNEKRNYNKKKHFSLNVGAIEFIPQPREDSFNGILFRNSVKMPCISDVIGGGFAYRILDYFSSIINVNSILFKVNRLSDNRQLIAKCVPNSGGYLNERKVLEEMSVYDFHYVLQPLDLFSQKNVIFMIYPQAECNLTHYMKRIPHRKKEHVLKLVLCQILQGLNELHSINLMHLDIKSDNVLLVNDVSNIKLIDFGFSKFRNKGSKILNGNVGTYGYIAPELFNNNGITPHPKHDMYSLGVMLYYLLTNKLCFGLYNNLETFNIGYKNYCHMFKEYNYISLSLQYIIMCLTNDNPFIRFSISQLATHGWFTEN